MKIATSIVSALSSIVLSAVVSAALYDCSKSDTYYEYRKAEYTLEPQNRVCVKISGKLKEGITGSANLALKFKYKIKPKSEITVTMRATMPDRVKEIFCVEGTITTL
ncbi:hypothetical protein BGW42_006527 [Actinomortierella wolfii]|nr:hypothetical protein BGW42_006527 [Actinomortierella wolfii]